MSLLISLPLLLCEQPEEGPQYLSFFPDLLLLSLPNGGKGGAKPNTPEVAGTSGAILPSAQISLLTSFPKGTHMGVSFLREPARGWC